MSHFWTAKLLTWNKSLLVFDSRLPFFASHFGILINSVSFERERRFKKCIKKFNLLFYCSFSAVQYLCGGSAGFNEAYKRCFYYEMHINAIIMNWCELVFFNFLTRFCEVHVFTRYSYIHWIIKWEKIHENKCFNGMLIQIVDCCVHWLTSSVLTIRSSHHSFIWNYVNIIKKWFN